MPIAIRCAECGTCYQAPDNLAGKVIRCRECKPLNRVPNQTPATVQAPLKSKADASTTEEKKPISSGFLRRRRTLFVAGFVSFGLVVFALAFALVIHYYRPLGQAQQRALSQVDNNALFLASEGEWKKAFAVIEGAITDEPTRPSHWYTRAKINMEYGNYGKAVEDLGTVLRLDPKWEEAAVLFAELKKKLQEASRARRFQEIEEDLRAAQNWLSVCERSLKDTESQARLYGGDEWNKLVKDSRQRLREAQEKTQTLERALNELASNPPSP